MTKAEQSPQSKELKGVSASEISRTHFSWRRWWLPAEFELQAGWGTPIFLPDPEGKFEKYYNRRAATLTDLAANRLLILCGEPAAGKTTVINDHFQDSASDVLLIRFREVLGEANFSERCFASEKWTALKAGKISLCLIVESLDEGRAQFSNLFDHLLSEIRALGSESRRKLSVILTCRTYDWEALKGREDELKQLLGLSEKTNEGT